MNWLTLLSNYISDITDTLPPPPENYFIENGIVHLKVDVHS